MIPELQNTLLGRKRRANEGEGIMNNTFTNRPVTMNENKNCSRESICTFWMSEEAECFPEYVPLFGNSEDSVQ